MLLVVVVGFYMCSEYSVFLKPGGWVQLGNRFVSFVRASEAKLHGRARGDKIVVLGLLRGSLVTTAAATAASREFPCPRRLSEDNIIKPHVKSLCFADHLANPM